jgi:YVTN family beta-propeller protein
MIPWDDSSVEVPRRLRCGTWQITPSRSFDATTRHRETIFVIWSRCFARTTTVSTCLCVGAADLCRRQRSQSPVPFSQQGLPSSPTAVVIPFTLFDRSACEFYGSPEERNMQSTQQRFWPALTYLVCLVGFAMLPRLAEAEPFVYVTNSGSNNLSVIDAATNTVTATIAVGNRPIGVAISPDGTRAYVANSDSNSLSVIATSENTVIATIPVGSFPQGLAVSPDGSHVYVANTFANSVSVIATATDTVIATVRVGINPTGIAILPDGSRAYVTNAGSSSVSVLDTATNAVVATAGVGVNALGITSTPDGTHAYVANNVSGSVSVIDTVSNTTVATIGMFQPVVIAVTPDGTRAYVTNSSASFGAVSVIDTATNTVIATVEVGPNAQSVAVTPDGRRAYATSFGSNSVWVIDTAANTVITTVVVESAPVGVAITPRIGSPTDKSQCKNGGWQTFTLPRTFKNQGACVSFVTTGK